MAIDGMSRYVWVALQAGCSQPDEADECSCETAVQLKASQAQHANTTLPTCTKLAKLDSAHTLSAPDEAMDLSGLQDQAQAVARAELLPVFIHQSLLQCARGNKLPASTPLYGLFRMLQEGQMLMVYGTNLLNIQMVTALSCTLCMAPSLFRRFCE